MAASVPIRHGVPLADFTYAKIGGQAQHLAVVNSVAELSAAVAESLKQGWPYRILGGGSNVLIADSGLPGLVIINRAAGLKLHQPSANQVTAESGVIVNQLVNTTSRAGLGGLEVFLGIPGTVGGAIYNNSHYLDQLIGTTIDTVAILDEAGKAQTLSRGDCRFGYDYSIFHEKRYTILSAVFTLVPGDPITLQAAALAALKRRRDTQPLEMPSSGCVFKNPDGSQGIFAGKLIDEAGCKGMAVGGAKVSDKHASFIVNTGRATAADYSALAEKVRAAVRDRFGITLEYEIIRLGNITEN
jgi:UDP-N-acetylmuramate dehydrogenase